jgi:hypothetical protein
MKILQLKSLLKERRILITQWAESLTCFDQPKKGNQTKNQDQQVKNVKYKTGNNNSHVNEKKPAAPARKLYIIKK